MQLHNSYARYKIVQQEAHLLQRNRAMIRVFEYFAKSLTVTQGYST